MHCCYISEIDKHTLPFFYLCYLNDTQFYLPATLDSDCSYDDPFVCFNELNFLQLNNTKTEVILCGTPSSINILTKAFYPHEFGLYLMFQWIVSCLLIIKSTENIATLKLFFFSIYRMLKQLSVCVTFYLDYHNLL